MNPLIPVIGGVLLAALLFGGGYCAGEKSQAAEDAKAAQKMQSEWQKLIDESDARASHAAEQAALAQIKLDTTIRKNAEKVANYVLHHPAAAARECLDADGVLLWNRDAATSADSLRPDDVQPRAGSAERARDG